MKHEEIELKDEINSLKQKLKLQDKRISALEKEIFNENFESINSKIQITKHIDEIKSIVSKMSVKTKFGWAAVIFFSIFIFSLMIDAEILIFFSFLGIIISGIGWVLLYLINQGSQSDNSIPKFTMPPQSHRFSNPPPITSIENEDIVAEPISHITTTNKESKKETSKDLELLLGGNWLNKIGMTILILGILFFLSYSFAQNWFLNEYKIILGIIVGISFLYAGEIFEKKQYHIYARTFTGGGSLILYLTFFVANTFYALINYYTSLGVSTIVTITTFLLALRYKSTVISYFGLIGVYLIPILMGVNNSSKFFLLIYYTIINIGLFGLLYQKPEWNILFFNYILGSYIMPLVIGLKTEILYYLFGYYIILNLLIIYLIYKNDFRNTLFLPFLGGYIIPSFGLANMQNINPNLFLIYSFIMAIIYMIVYYFKDWKLETFIPIGISLILIPFIFWGEYTLNNAYLFIIAILSIITILAYIKNSKILYYGILVWAIIIPRLMIHENSLINNIPFCIYLFLISTILLIISHIKNWNFTEIIAIIFTYPILSQIISPYHTFESYLLLTIFFILFLISNIIRIGKCEEKNINEFDIISLVLNGAIYALLGTTLMQKIDILKDFDGIFIACLSLIYFILGFIIYKVAKINSVKELNSYTGYNKPVMALMGMSLMFLTIVFPIQFNGNVLTLSWLSQSFVLIFLGFKITNSKLRNIGLVIFIMGLFRYFTIDFVTKQSNYIALFNIKSLTFIYVIILSGLIAYLYLKNKKESKTYEKYISSIFFGLLGLLVWIYITYETTNLFEGIMQNMMITLFWALYATILIILGFIKKIRSVRIFSLLVFTFTIMKLFLADIWRLDRIFRIIAFIGLGILLLGASFLYNKFKLIVHEDIKND